jgi:hypothetical protein
VKKVFGKISIAAALALAAITLGNCNQEGAYERTYCGLACDFLTGHGTNPSGYKSAWACKQECNVKLEDAGCRSIFRDAADCFKLNCGGKSFFDLPDRAACQHACGDKLKPYYACTPAPVALGRPSVTDFAAKVLPEPDRDAKAPNAPIGGAGPGH